MTKIGGSDLLSEPHRTYYTSSPSYLLHALGDGVWSVWSLDVPFVFAWVLFRCSDLPTF